MTANLSEEEIAELRRLEREATPGRWTVEAEPEKLAFNVLNVRDDWPDRPVAWLGANQADPMADAALIAAARNALPKLLAERDELRERLRIPCDGCPGCPNDCCDTHDFYVSHALDELAAGELRARAEKAERELAQAKKLMTEAVLILSMDRNPYDLDVLAGRARAFLAPKEAERAE